MVITTSERPKRKIKVLDTNIFLNKPEGCTEFANQDPSVSTEIIIPIEVINELDRLKNDRISPRDDTLSNRGFKARESFRVLDSLIKEHGGDLAVGIPVRENYTIGTPMRDCFKHAALLEESLNMYGIDRTKVDHRIIATARFVSELHQDAEVEIVTEDLAMQLNAPNYGVRANKWEQQHTPEKQRELYRGWRMFFDPAKSIAAYLKSNKGVLELQFLPEAAKSNPWRHNEYMIVTPDSGDFLGENATTKILCYDARKERFEEIHLLGRRVKPRNAFQACYIHALQGPSSYVYGIGAAGTGKSFLSVHEGMYSSLEMFRGLPDDESGHGEGKKQSHLPNPVIRSGEYKRVILARPRVGDKQQGELGFLPGEMDNKLAPWLMPLYDSLIPIMELYGNDAEHARSIIEISGLDPFKEYQDNRIIIVDSFYITGRSLADAFFILDDAQNYNGETLGQLCTRAARNTKTVIEGDPDNQAYNGALPQFNPMVSASNQWAKSDVSCASTVWFPSDAVVRSDAVKLYIQVMGIEQGIRNSFSVKDTNPQFIQL